MVTEERAVEPVPEESIAFTNGDEPEVKAPEAPYLGRSARIVGDWKSVDASETPHEKNTRGELGQPLFNWYFNRVGSEPIARISYPSSSADRRNTLQGVVTRAGQGDVSPQKIGVADPLALTQHIKRVAEFFGADVVRIAQVHPSMLYSGSRYPDDGSGAADARGGANRDSEEVARDFPYAICLCTSWDYDMIQAHRHHVGDYAYHFSQARLQLVYANVAAYIREMGYEVVQSRTQPMPVALAAGVGELGRNGMLITEKFGARIHLGDPILTNMPLIDDKPIDIGVEDFCKVCRKCATTCPTNSISMEDKVVHNGVEKYKINWETCYRLRAHVMEFWEVCLTCVTVCPYTKPNSWWRTLAVQTLKQTPVPLRSTVVRGLKFLDDTFWGKVPRKRVKWLHYDSGIIPIKKARGDNNGATDSAHGEPADPKGKVGYYYPLKENTRRFDIMKERTNRTK